MVDKSPHRPWPGPRRLSELFGRQAGELASLMRSIAALHQGGCYQPRAPGMPVLIIESFAPLHNSELYTLLLQNFPIPFAAGKTPVPAGRYWLPADAGSWKWAFHHGHGGRGGGAGTTEAHPCAAQQVGQSAGMRWDSLAQAAPRPRERAPHAKPRCQAFVLWAFIIHVRCG